MLPTAEDLQVVDCIPVHDHKELHDALTRKDCLSAIKLLRDYGDNHIPYSIYERVQDIPSSEPYLSRLKDELFQCVIKVTENYTLSSEMAKWLNAWIAYWKFSPWLQDCDIDTESFSDYLFDNLTLCQNPRQAAMLILSLNAHAEIYRHQCGSGVDMIEPVLRQCIINEVSFYLEERFVACYDKRHAIAFFESLCMLRGGSAWHEVLRLRGRPFCLTGTEGFYNGKLLNMRQGFIKEIYGSSSVDETEVFMTRLQRQMFQKHGMMLMSQSRILVHALLADMGSWELGAMIESAFEKRLVSLTVNASATSEVLRLSAVSNLAQTQSSLRKRNGFHLGVD